MPQDFEVAHIMHDLLLWPFCDAGHALIEDDSNMNVHKSTWLHWPFLGRSSGHVGCRFHVAKA